MPFQILKASTLSLSFLPTPRARPLLFLTGTRPSGNQTGRHRSRSIRTGLLSISEAAPLVVSLPRRRYKAVELFLSRRKFSLRRRHRSKPDLKLELVAVVWSSLRPIRG
ncbi:PREDICTED: uncharacterized protein LOC101310836 [Fragaria vesca subsp. vesca]